MSDEPNKDGKKKGVLIESLWKRHVKHSNNNNQDPRFWDSEAPMRPISAIAFFLEQLLNC